MKRTNAKDKRDLKLKQRLALVRTTVRVLTPTELEHINGGTETSPKDIEITGCGVWPFTV
ncbi:MAG TPA: hypothetical protein VK932_28210 [Kofleriaceae bacterium]|nr:hypothetical protein [Kofleriaceae bacterium]